MKVLHVVFSFPPDPPGGTELYVTSLARALQEFGVESVIAAPASVDAAYDHEGLRVRRFSASSDHIDLAELYAGRDEDAAACFDRILDEEQPDVVHQHALTYSCSLEIVRRAKRRGVPVVFTYHTASTTCQRGTLIEMGSVECDGRVEARRCAACTLDGLQTGPVAAKLLAAMPHGGGELLGRLGRRGGAWTALRMSSLMKRRLTMLQAFLSEIDCFVALTPWVADVLVRNGVSSEKIVRSAHGIPTLSPLQRRSTKRGGDRLRVVHLGRSDPAKGTELLVRALRAAPAAPIDLDVYGIVQTDAAAAEAERHRDIAAGDPRVKFLSAVPHAMVPALLTQYDVVAVPSQCRETGPLVVLEAFRSGVPVVGSDVGGIRELVTPGIDGLLVAPFHSEQAWRDALLSCTVPGRVAALANGIQPPKPVTAAALEMRDLYESLVATSASIGQVACAP